MKINFLSLDERLIENIIEYFCDDIKTFHYKKTDYSMVYSFKLNEMDVSFHFRNKLQYFQESNVNFYNDINGIIIIFSDYKNIKNIWKTEIIKNNLEDNIPVLLLEINNNKELNEISKEFYDIFKYISYIKLKKNNKKMSKNILKTFINKCKTIQDLFC
jgi:hypothetical protein